MLETFLKNGNVVCVNKSTKGFRASCSRNDASPAERLAQVTSSVKYGETLVGALESVIGGELGVDFDVDIGPHCLSMVCVDDFVAGLVSTEWELIKTARGDSLKEVLECLK